MANVIRIKRRTSGSGLGAALPTGLRNAELAFNEVNNTLYIGRGGTADGTNADAISTAIVGDGAVWTGTATFGTVNTTGAITSGEGVYAYNNAVTSGKLLATSEYVDSAVARSTGSGMSLFPVAADCATTGPLNTSNYYDNLEGLGTVRIAVPAPVSAADAALLYELKGLPVVQSITLAAGNRVLIMGHTDASLIGLWKIPTGAGAATYWERDVGYEVPQSFPYGARVAVSEGTYAGQNFSVASDPLYPSKDVAGPNFNSLNFIPSSSAAPTGAAIKFKRVVRAKGDFYTIVNGKVVVDGITLNQNDRFIWTPKNASTGGGDGTGASYNNPRAGIYRVNYDRIVLDIVTGAPDPYAVIQRAGDLNESTEFVSANNTKVLVREGTNNSYKIFTISTGGTFTVDDAIGTVALFNYDSTWSYTTSNALTGIPIIDGYQTAYENLSANPPVIGSVVLVKNEINPVSNGLYYIKTNGSWIRHPSADATNELVYGSYIRVENGSVNKNTGFVQVTNLDTITPGTHPLVFEAPSALLDFTAGYGLGRSGKSFYVKTANANRIAVTDTGVDLATISGLSSAIYGTSTSVPAVTVNTYGQVTAISTNAIPSSSTTVVGLVQLEDSTSSTSTTKAATPNSVKSAYDTATTASTTATAAQTTANAALPKAGTSAMTGKLTTVASTTTTAAVNVPSGVAPTAPSTGDFWNESGALKFNNGSTKTIAYTDSSITGTSGGLNYTSTATAAATTTLTNASTYLQYFTGTTTQTVVLPVNTTLANTTRQFEIHNNSTGALTVNSSGNNSVVTVAAGVIVKLTCTNTASGDTTATPWVVEYIGATTSTGSGKLVYATSPDFTTSITTASTTIGVFDANATTVNAFSAASSGINMGHASGTTLIKGDLTLGAAASGKKLRLNGATSGTVDIQAAATAGSNTATFPAATGNVILDTTNGLSSSTLAGMLSDETGSGLAVFATTPIFTTSVVNAAASTTFGVFNGAASILNAFGNAASVNIASDSSFTSALILNIGNNVPASGQPRTINIGTAGASNSTSNIVIGAPPTNGTSTTTLQGTVVIAGNLTVNGATTVLNTNTLSVDDKNIELGAGTSVTATCTVTAGSAVVTNLSSVAGIVVGGQFAVSSNFGTVIIPANTTVASVDSLTQITLSAALTGTGSQNNAVALIGSSTPSDATAAGGGITLKSSAGSDKTIIWNDATKGWEFNQNVTTSGTTVNVNGSNPTIATSQTSGTATVFGGTFAGTVAVGNNGATTRVSVPSTQAATATTDGALVVAGGVGIGGAVFAGSNITTSGNLVTTGSGTATIAGSSVNINGSNPSIATTQTTGTATIFSGMPNISIADTSTAAGTISIGTGAVATGLTRAINIGTGTSAGTVNLTVGSSNAGTTTINSPTVAIGQATGTTTISSPTIATGVTTGTLAVFNTGLTGTLNIGGAAGTITIGAATGNSTFNIQTGVQTTGTKDINIGTGATGGTTTIKLGPSALAVGAVQVQPTTAATSTSTGALIVSGGTGIGGALYVGGVGRITDATDSTSTSDGSLAVSGGVGIAKKLYVGDNLTISTGKALNLSTANTLTAAGANQGTALALTSDINIVTTTASGTGVVLPTPTVGRVVVVVNRGTNNLNVFPASAHYIDGTQNSARILAVNATMILRAATTTTWFSEITDLTNSATGTLPVGNGGTGLATITSNGIIYGNTTGNVGATSAGSQYQVLQAGSGGTPAFGAVVLNQSAAVSGSLAIGNGGTGQNTASAAFNALSPTTTLGDIIYGSGNSANSRLAGNTTSTRRVLTQTGTGTVSAAPAWVNQCDIVADCTLDGGTF